jgi:tRNA nucleotidyltransferase (CCA-adding enzyme)
MSEAINLADKIQKSLPAEPVALIKKAVTVAASRNLQLYLVGGFVRDLLLWQMNFDLDLVVEGDAIGLAKEFAEKVGGKLTVHTMFNTAKVTLDKWTIDFAMARTETYAKPGALPTVKPGTIKTDLYRRDFTVNAIAICLSPENNGELLDLYGGMNDLNGKKIRVLHNKSFIDDATRIWRAIRYEQRLGFKIEADTLKLLKRDVAMLKTVGGYRLRHELELVLKEKEPEKALVRADKLGVLKELHPSLKADEWLAAKFATARAKGRANPDFYLGLLTARLTDDETAEFVAYLRLPKQTVDAMREKRSEYID